MAHMPRVTVDKSYFDALLRRANVHGQQNDEDTANITILKVEYQNLLRATHEYDLLKNALLQGGIAQDTLDLLVTDTPSSPGLSPDWQSSHGHRHDSVTSASDENVPLYAPRLPWAHGKPTQPQKWSQYEPPSFQMTCGQRDGFNITGSVLEETATVYANDTPDTDSSAAASPRTLYFMGLPEGTTHRDLLSAVKGGKVLSINLRPEWSATVSLYTGAADFLAWTKRNGLYIKGKRIDVKWADRQFNLSPHIQNKIRGGATRNVLIHAALDSALTEDRIRADLEHIHTLVVIDVVFRGGDAYISTNAVHNAFYARSCLMSRKIYHGHKIEFYRDECDVPLPLPPRSTAPAPCLAKTMTSQHRLPPSNRFNCLKLDDARDRSSEDDNESESPYLRIRRTSDSDNGEEPGASICSVSEGW